jgi:3-phenylpropionate/trans-cinnamate dioxygenase ferredoxin component
VSEFQQVCRQGDVALNTAKRYIVDGIAMAIVRTPEGVFAINDRCSHADVSLSEGEVDGCAIECWLHGSAFDLRTGVPLSLPAIEPVPVYAVRVDGEGDEALVQVDPTPIPATTVTPGH